MKQLNTLMRAAALALILILAVTGCSLVQVDEEKDRMLAVAKVNGEDIHKGDWQSFFNQQSIQIQQYYAQMGMSVTEEDLEEYKLTSLDAMIEDLIVEQKAIEAGFSPSAEDISAAREETLQSIADYYRSTDESNEDAEVKTDEEYLADAEELIKAEAEGAGKSLDELFEEIAMQNTTVKFKEEALQDIIAGEEEIKAYYDENIAAQKETPAQAVQAEIALYEPEGIWVKHILIKLDETQFAEYQALADGEDGEAAAKEYADGILLDKVNAVLAEAKTAPDSFETLIDEYGQDPGMTDNEQGYFVQATGSFMPAFEEAALALSIGSISEPVFVGDYYVGYHILKAYEQVDAMEYSFEEKEAEIRQLLDQQAKDTEWADRVAQWKEASEIKIYKSRLK